MDVSRTSLALACCACCFVLSTAGHGQSQVASNAGHRLTVWQDGEWVSVRGDIRDIQGSILVFEPAGQFNLKSLPLSTIKSFTFTSNANYARGVSSFGTKNYRAAEQHFEKAVQAEGRDWAKLEILIRIAESMVADNRRKDSIAIFQQIYRMAPDSRLLGQLPLVWDADLPAKERLVLPADRMTTADEVTRLAIASCYLHDEDYQSRAKAVLKKLRTVSKSPAIAHLATAQLWRLSLLDKTDTVLMLTDVWEKQWHRMPASVRSGPGYVLGRCLQQQNEFDRAALVLLWSPYVKVNDFAIAAASLKSAAACLDAAGRKSESDSVFRELVQRFADQSSAK